jgi:chromosome segregation ATPase
VAELQSQLADATQKQQSLLSEAAALSGSRVEELETKIQKTEEDAEILRNLLAEAEQEGVDQAAARVQIEKRGKALEEEVERLEKEVETARAENEARLNQKIDEMKVCLFHPC